MIDNSTPPYQLPNDGRENEQKRKMIQKRIVIGIITLVVVLFIGINSVIFYQFTHAKATKSLSHSTTIAASHSSVTATPTNTLTKKAVRATPASTQTMTQATPSLVNPGSSSIGSSGSGNDQSPVLGSILVNYRGHTNGILTVAWSPDGTRIATGSSDTTIQIWNARTGARILTYRGHTRNVTDLVWSPDGTRIASTAVSENAIKVWNANTGQTLFTYNDPNPTDVGTLSWSPDGNSIAFVQDGTGAGMPFAKNFAVSILNIATQKVAKTFPYNNYLTGLQWSPDGKYLVFGTFDAKIFVYDTSSWNLQLTYTGAGENGSILDLSWSPDSTKIASGGGNNSVQIWNVSNGKQLYAYSGAVSTVQAIAWSPDGKRIASSNGQQVELLDASNGHLIYTFNGHSEDVTDLAWSPDSTRVVSVSEGNAQGEALVWQAR